MLLTTASRALSADHTGQVNVLEGFTMVDNGSPEDVQTRTHGVSTAASLAPFGEYNSVWTEYRSAGGLAYVMTAGIT